MAYEQSPADPGERPRDGAADAKTESSAGAGGSPPPVPADARDVQEPMAEDMQFLDMLRDAGLIAELTPEEVLRLTMDLPRHDTDARRLSLLERYYRGGGDDEARERRVLSDRWFIHHDTSLLTAPSLVENLGRRCPEIGPTSLERIGDPEHGQLVLRAGEHFAAVLDDYEEQLDTGEVDLRTLDAAADASTISVNGLVKAMNVLLSRHDVSWRLLELCSDGEREAYVALDIKHSMILCGAGYLELEHPEEMMEFAAW